MKAYTILLLALAIAPVLRAQSEEHIGIHQLQSIDAARGVDSAVGARHERSDGSASPRSMRALSKRVFGWVPYWISPSRWERFDWSALTAVGYFSMEADTSGRARSLRAWPAPSLAAMARANGVQMILTVTCFGAAANAALLSNPVHRTRMVATIVDAIDSGAGDGVNLDFESVPGSQRENLVAFVRELSPRVRAVVPDAEISMAIPAVDWTNAFDVATLSDVCDYLIMMGYDYHWSGAPNAGSVAPLAGDNLNITRSVQTYLANGVAPERLLLGVPWYGYDWGTVDSTRGSATTSRGVPVLYEAAQEAAALYGKMFDAATSTPWHRYSENSMWRQAWYDDSLSLALKYRFVNERGLGGIGIWALGYEGSATDVWRGIHQAFDEPSSIAHEMARDGVRLAVRDNRLLVHVNGMQRVTVTMTDVLGRHAVTLVDEQLDAGVHIRVLDDFSTVAGLYVVHASSPITQPIIMHRR